MAGKESEKTSNNRIINDASESSSPKSNDSSAAVSFSEKRMSELEQLVRSFGSVKSASFSDYLDWMNLFDRFEAIFKDIDDFTHSISEAEYSSIKDRIEALSSELLFYNDKFSRNYNFWTAERGKSIEERADKQQILNFTVFSLFMTLLTFLLSNIVVITKTDFTLKTIIVINLILLLAASVIPDFGKQMKNMVLKLKAKHLFYILIG